MCLFRKMRERDRGLIAVLERSGSCHGGWVGDGHRFEEYDFLCSSYSELLTDAQGKMELYVVFVCVVIVLPESI